MAKTRQQKEQSLEQLSAALQKSKSAVFANFQGLKVKDSEELRKICRNQNITYTAIKKTLLQRILTDLKLDVDTGTFSGGVAVVLGIEDEVAPAKLLADFAKKHESVTFFGGILEGRFLAAQEVISLSKVPTKQELLGRLVGSINAPVSGFVNVLAGNLRNLVGVLNNIKESKA
ncbi:MAG: 50S ribosomal protein L10 [Candidatus Magasanikbacteria bacterium]